MTTEAAMELVQAGKDSLIQFPPSRAVGRDMPALVILGVLAGAFTAFGAIFMTNRVVPFDFWSVAFAA